jgi:hypothetical protein
MQHEQNVQLHAAHLKVDSNGHTVYPSTTDSQYSKGRLPTAKRTGSRAVVRRLVHGQTEVQLVYNQATIVHHILIAAVLYVEFKRIRRSMLLHLKCQRTTALWVYVPHIT